MDEQTTAVVPEGTPAEPVPEVPAGTTGTGLTEDKVKSLIEEATSRLKNDLRSARSAQSEADRRAALAEKRAQMAESALDTIPNTLGDVDPEVRNRVQVAALERRLGNYRNRDQEEQQIRAIEDQKRAVLEATKDDISALGLDPDDPRITYDLDQPNPASFRKKALASARDVLKTDSQKTNAEIIKEQVAAEMAKVRKESGVDSHDSGGAGKVTFTKDQFLDRAFYKENKVEMDKAAREGRVQ